MKLTFLSSLLSLALVAAHAAEPVQGVILPFKKISVPSPVLQEIISEMLVEEGTEVKEGQVIVQLRNEREKLDVEIAEKSIDLYKFIAAGHERLFNEKMGSQEKALEAKTNYELAQIQKKAKQFSLDEKTIRATISGVVVKKYKESGEAVDRAEKILDIMNYDQVYARFNLPSELRKTLQMDAPMRVKVLDLDGAEFTGKIAFIDPSNDMASGLVGVKILIDNKDHRIKPGMKSAGVFAK
jgi:RND family efflux transporter MFP subunit